MNKHRSKHQRSRLASSILESSASGDPKAAEQLVTLLYTELRQLARAMLAKLPPGQTLQPTGLVHEAFVRILGTDDASWEDRKHFFAAAAQAMRHVLIDQARRKATRKHGRGRRRVELNEEAVEIEPPSDDVLALHEALNRLEKEDPRKGQIVLQRYFGGLTIEETARMLEVSVATVERDWRFARAWLHRELGGGSRGDD